MNNPVLNELKKKLMNSEYSDFLMERKESNQTNKQNKPREKN